MGVIVVLHRFFTTCFLGFLFLQGFCDSDKVPHFSFVHDASSAPLISYYDYIIVGGGTAGCPLAATLSQKANVLLLERGGSPYGNPNITNSVGFSATLSDLSSTSPSQTFISEDGVTNTRARVLGGGSCINAGFYSRASAKYIRDMEWDEGLVTESYEWVEKEVVFEPKVEQWQSTVRDALLEVGVLPYNGLSYDHIYGTKTGGTIFDKNGIRHTAADLLHYANPSGLTVLLRASVHQILFETKEKSKPMAYGVVYQDESGIVHKAYLKEGYKNEIIVSAGALGSPQLLILSGLGPIDQLKAHNITVVKEQAMIGQHMTDNPMNGVFIPSPLPVEYSLIEVVGITRFGFNIESSSGTYFGATPSDLSMFSPLVDQQSKGPCIQRRAEAFRNAIKRKHKGDQETDIVRAGFIFEKVAYPKSTGHLELRTTDPNDNPSVTFNYFKEAEDLQACVDGISTIRKMMDSNSFSEFRYDNISTTQLLSLTADSNEPVPLEKYCKETVMTNWHYHGGCQVGSVVDSNYKVLGVDALRVIDGSTFNASPGTNPQATLMMLGRYMGVSILRERNNNGLFMFGRTYFIDYKVDKIDAFLLLLFFILVFAIIFY